MTVNVSENFDKLDFVRKLFEFDKAPHAWIIRADGSLIEQSLALYAAYAVSKGGTDKHNYDLALAGKHPDVFYYPQRGRKTISVEDIKDVISLSQNAPTMGGAKVFAINASTPSSADNWQGKILKIFEEPPANTYILIGTANTGELHDTVLSRAIVVDVPKQSFFEIKQQLISKSFKEETAEIVAFLSGGSIYEAMRILNDPLSEKLFYDTLNMLSNIKGTADSLQYAALLNNYKDRYRLLFSAMQNFFAEIIRHHHGKQWLKSIDITKLIENFSVEAAANAVVLVDNAYVEVVKHVNFNMVMDNLILRILEVRYRCPK
jgi:hypothetical protein